MRDYYSSPQEVYGSSARLYGPVDPGDAEDDTERYKWVPHPLTHPPREMGIFYETALWRITIIFGGNESYPYVSGSWSFDVVAGTRRFVNQDDSEIYLDEVENAPGWARLRDAMEGLRHRKDPPPEDEGEDPYHNASICSFFLSHQVAATGGEDPTEAWRVEVSVDVTGERSGWKALAAPDSPSPPRWTDHVGLEEGWVYGMTCSAVAYVGLGPEGGGSTRISTTALITYGGTPIGTARTGYEASDEEDAQWSIELSSVDRFTEI